MTFVKLVGLSSRSNRNLACFARRIADFFMKINLPVTQTEVEMPEGAVLVSTTDTQGRITHCNRAFVQISGFSYDELLGQPHHLVRHPDMPSEAYADMWSTIGRGRPWSGIVKNRCKNGDFYWVQANVSPVMEGGKPAGYMSVRLKPTRDQVREAEQLYRRPIMAAFHGLFSVGGVLGSVIGFGTLALDLPPYVTLSIASAIGLLAVWLCSRPLLPHVDVHAETASTTGKSIGMRIKP